MHARHQPAKGMMALVELGRLPAGDRDVLGRRLHQIVGQAGFWIGHRIAVEVQPAGVMVHGHVDHQLTRLRRLEALVAEGARELARQGGVLIHHDGEMRFALRRGLDDHALPLSLISSAISGGTSGTAQASYLNSQVGSTGVRSHVLPNEMRRTLSTRCMRFAVYQAKLSAGSSPPNCGDATRQDAGVLDRHRGARRHVGPHRVTGIAQHHDAVAIPGVDRLDVVDRPLRHLGRGLDHLAQLGVVAVEGSQELVAVARHERRGLVPFRLRRAGDEVNLLARLRHVVDEDVVARSPPFGAGADRQSLEQAHRKDGAMRDMAGVARLLRAEQDTANLRGDAIGADHQIGFRLMAVLEGEPHGRA